MLSRAHLPLLVGVFLLLRLPEYAWQLHLAGWSVENYPDLILKGGARPDGIDWLDIAGSAFGALADGIVVLGVYLLVKGVPVRFSRLVYGVIAAAPRLVIFALVYSLLYQIARLAPGSLFGLLFALGLYGLQFVYFFLFTPICLLENRPVIAAMSRSVDLTQGKRLGLLGLAMFAFYAMTMLHVTLLQLMKGLPYPIFIVQALLFAAISGYFSVLSFVIYQKVAKV